MEIRFGLKCHRDVEDTLLIPGRSDDVETKGHTVLIESAGYGNAGQSREIGHPHGVVLTHSRQRFRVDCFRLDQSGALGAGRRDQSAVRVGLRAEIAGVGCPSSLLSQIFDDPVTAVPLSRRVASCRPQEAG